MADPAQSEHITRHVARLSSACVSHPDRPGAGSAPVSDERTQSSTGIVARRRDSLSAIAPRSVIANVYNDLAAIVGAGLAAETLRMHVARAVNDLSRSVHHEALPEAAALLVRSRLDNTDDIFRGSDISAAKALPAWLSRRKPNLAVTGDATLLDIRGAQARGWRVRALATMPRETTI